ncbi:MAG: hypothetical protein KGZ69_16180, partial [Methylomonas sp.]|nr:hypothetical protein [Methylomonas sp.]
MIAKKQTTKKQTREQNGRSGSPLLHRDLKEKLMIGQAVSDASTQIGFARELAEKLKPKLVAKTDDKVTDKQNQAAFETYAKGLNDLISNVMDLTTKNPSTYELINGTSEFLGINGKASEYLAQISVNDYFLLIHPENQQILIDKINLPIADAALIEIGKKLGIDRSESTHCPPRNSAVNDDLHPVYLDIGKFEFCDLDKHDVAEIQKYMYFDSSAVNNWGGLISDADNSYPNYHHCKQSLKDFLDSDYWKNLVND